MKENFVIEHPVIILRNWSY